MDLGIFELLKAKSPRSAEEIASSTNGSPDLVCKQYIIRIRNICLIIVLDRILRCLGAHGSLKEEADGSYGATRVSSTFTDRGHQAAMNVL
jgi:hypothetical protein